MPEGAVFGGKKVLLGIKTGAAFRVKKRPKPVSDHAREVHFMVKTGAALRVKKRPKPVSDAARQVHFGIKKVLL